MCSSVGNTDNQCQLPIIVHPKQKLHILGTQRLLTIDCSPVLNFHTVDFRLSVQDIILVKQRTHSTQVKLSSLSALAHPFH